MSHAYQAGFTAAMKTAGIPYHGVVEYGIENANNLKTMGPVDFMKHKVKNITPMEAAITTMSVGSVGIPILSDHADTIENRLGVGLNAVAGEDIYTPQSNLDRFMEDKMNYGGPDLGRGARFFREVNEDQSASPWW